jgi:NAD(P)H dehydrogenase (quinone)
MFVITGITGRVGGVAADLLLAQGHPVRAVVRHAEKGAQWEARGCQVAVVPDMGDAEALAEACQGATGVFLMNPPDYDPEPSFAENRRNAEAAARALALSKPQRTVVLSTVGAHVTTFNLLNWGHIYESVLPRAGRPVAFLRAAWFMENATWDVAAAREGRIDSFLQPLDHRIEMVSVRDVGRAASELLVEPWDGLRTVELAGPRAYSANDVAKGFAAALGKPVDAVAVPRGEWEPLFRQQGMVHPEARIRMLDGFNEGWIDFERGHIEQRRGDVPLDDVLADLVRRA